MPAASSDYFEMPLAIFWQRVDRRVKMHSPTGLPTIVVFTVSIPVVFQDEATGRACDLKMGQTFTTERIGWRDYTPEEVHTREIENLIRTIRDTKGLSSAQIEEVRVLLSRAHSPSTGRSRYEVLGEEPLV